MIVDNASRFLVTQIKGASEIYCVASLKWIPLLGIAPNNSAVYGTHPIYALSRWKSLAEQLCLSFKRPSDPEHGGKRIMADREIEDEAKTGERRICVSSQAWHFREVRTGGGPVIVRRLLLLSDLAGQICQFGTYPPAVLLS